MNTGEPSAKSSSSKSAKKKKKNRPSSSISLGHRPSSLSRHRPRHRPDHLLVITTRDFRISRILSSLNDVDGWSAEHVWPVPFMENRPSVVSVAKGLVCLTYNVAGGDIDIGQYVVWNPLTKKYKLIPSPNIQFPPCTHVYYDHEDDTGCTSMTYSYGASLGFEPQSGDYKILIFTTIVYSGGDHRIHTSFKQISIYSLNENSWKEIENSEYSKVLTALIDYSFCFDGVLYFKCSDYVVAFDLALEEFSTFPFPDVLLREDSRIYLVEFNESLAFVVSTLYGAAKHFRIWIMDVVDGVRVWVKKESLNMCGFDADVPLGSCNNGRSFFFQGSDGMLLEYDFVTREMKTIQQFFDYPLAMSRLFSYVETTAEL